MMDLKIRYVMKVVKCVERVNDNLEYLESHGHIIKRVIPYKFGSGRDSTDGFYIIYTEKVER